LGWHFYFDGRIIPALGGKGEKMRTDHLKIETRSRVPAERGRITALSRMIGAAAGVSLLGLFLGCMSFSIGGRNYECHRLDGLCDNEVLSQHGAVRLSPGDEQDVYYPIPYASPPNLELGDLLRIDYILLEQRADHFRVRIKSCLDLVTLTWKARGVRAPAIVAQPAVPAQTAADAQDPVLPVAPTPILGIQAPSPAGQAR
jgi:hypothetical protein